MHKHTAISMRPNVMVNGAARVHREAYVPPGCYTHLTDQTKHHAIERINGLMNGFEIVLGRVK